MQESQQQKIHVKIAWIQNEHGKPEPEILMAGSDFFSSSSSITKKISNFKEIYLELIEAADKLRKSSKRQSKKVSGHLSSKQIWKMSKLLADFKERTENDFEIINEKIAFSRDLKLSERLVREFLHFGKYFEEEEVHDEIPYSTYIEVCSKISSLKRKRIFDQEKAWLSERVAQKDVPKRDEYRKRLEEILS